jgi:hypothetical protein
MCYGDACLFQKKKEICMSACARPAGLSISAGFGRENIPAPAISGPLHSGCTIDSQWKCINKQIRVHNSFA